MYRLLGFLDKSKNAASMFEIFRPTWGETVSNLYKTHNGLCSSWFLISLFSFWTFSLLCFLYIYLKLSLELLRHGHLELSSTRSLFYTYTLSSMYCLQIWKRMPSCHQTWRYITVINIAIVSNQG